MAWRCWKIYSATYKSENNPKLFKRITVKREEYSPWQYAVCRFITKLGDFLSAGRRRSWVGDQIWSKHLWGFYFHSRIKSYLLYARWLKGEWKWHTGEVYRFA